VSTPDKPRWQPPKLTFGRLSGVDRSGPPPPQTLPGAPLNPWTIPNAIGYVRFALLPVFLVIALSSGDGIDGTAALVYALIAWGDYADGIAARVTKQYSRLGALMDPVIDRLLVISGIVVVWKFELLPRWALGVLIFRELLMLLGGRYALKRGVVLQINWIGRWGVWPTMTAIFAALVGWHTVALVMLYIGLLMSYAATVAYARDAQSQLQRNEKTPSTSG
jgi:CDP-diacylglycerol--glycerol-3-phosphate 3-phosphatidyltransferase